MENCNCHTAGNRDGSGQLQRYLKALDPSYAPINGQTQEELLVFAKRFAAQVRFYDIPESNINDGLAADKVSWREFFRRDMSVIAASVATTNTIGFKNEFEEVRQRLEENPTPGLLGALFAPVIGMLKKMDRWYSVAIPENPLHKDLLLAIQSTLQEQARLIQSYEAGFKIIDPKADLQIDWKGIENESTWGLDQPVVADASIYKGATDEDKIRNASLFIEDIFHSFYGVLHSLVHHSDKYIHFAKEQYPAHQPQMALFITFLQLFNTAKEQLNGLTGRMLDFYYKEVLHLENKPSVPDKAHIVFELAKDVATYPLAEGTALKAGKDDSGKEQQYFTDSELVINQAKVKELKTIFVQRTGQDRAAASQVIHSLYARPVAKSLDGMGAPFTGDDIKWPTFGKGEPVKTKPRNICETIDQLVEITNRNDEAQVGFAIASPQLLLQGGKRLIRIKLPKAVPLLEKDMELAKANDVNFFECWFTGEKGWFKVDSRMSQADQLLLTKFLPVGIFNPLADSLEPSYFIDAADHSLFIYLPDTGQGVLAYDTKLHSEYNFATSQPVLKVMLNNQLDIKASDFHTCTTDEIALAVKVGSVFPVREEWDNFIKEMDSKKIVVTAEEKLSIFSAPADGLKKLVLQNETGLLTAGKPFDPFTAYPAQGKSFYIGSQEAFNKPLQRLAVNIKRTQDARSIPAPGLEKMIISNNNNFTNDFSVSVLEKRSWLQLSDPSGNDFSQPEMRRNILHRPIYDANGDPTGSKPVKLTRLPVLPVTQWDIITEKGFLQIQNLISTPDDMQGRQNLATELEIKEVSLSYESDLTSFDNSIDEFYHVYPFGVLQSWLKNTATMSLKENFSLFNKENLLLAGKTPGGKLQSNITRSFLSNTQFTKLDQQKDYLLVNAGNILLPQFSYQSPYSQYTAAKGGVLAARQAAAKKNTDELTSELMLSASGLMDKVTGGANQYTALQQEEGMLFIGLEKAAPLQMVSMLFQFAEGSAADEDNDPPVIHWSYLTNNEWRPMREESIVSDGTYGFQTTGIVKLEIPADATNNNTIITNGLYWICASVTSNSNRIPMLIDVVTQAVLATFSDNGNAQSHFDKALPAGSISKLAETVSQVSKVQQPFASFDGKHREVGAEFYTRSSERLRHKGRAITAWDYEHLVLDRFPSVFKVKCIVHTDPNCLCREHNQYAIPRLKKECCGPQVAPGHVLLIPIADFKNRNAVNPLQPKTARRTLMDIVTYISGKTSPFVKVYAKNPVYEQVLVFFRVKFKNNADKGYYLRELNKEIVHYLTPWAFDDKTEIKFGQKIYASSIINFIEERSYVDFITDFLMVVCRTPCCPDTKAITKRAAEGKDTPADIFASICGCEGVEVLLQDETDFPGDIVAKPSTPRSILVSVPQHIIIPYEEPVTGSLCEERKKLATKPVAVEIGDDAVVIGRGDAVLHPATEDAVTPAIPANDVVTGKETPARRATAAEKKPAVKTAPVKKSTPVPVKKPVKKTAPKSTPQKSAAKPKK